MEDKDGQYRVKKVPKVGRIGKAEIVAVVCNKSHENIWKNRKSNDCGTSGWSCQCRGQMHEKLIGNVEKSKLLPLHAKSCMKTLENYKN